MRVRAMITAGHLETDAAASPAELLGRSHQQTANAALAISGSNHEARDTAKKPRGVKERDAMKGKNASDAVFVLGDENGGMGGVDAIRDALLDLRDHRGIPESRQ